jgi:hypothetical protein
MPEVFLSYAREDRELVERLAARLEAAGYRVWWDRHLAGGAAFAREIEQRIEGALAVVVVWTEAATKSHWVQEEASAGRDAGKLIPLRVGQVSPPMGFRQLHAIDYAESGGRPDESAVAALIADLQRHNGDAVQSAHFLAEPKSMPASRSPIAAGAVVAVIALVVAYVLFQPFAPSRHGRDTVPIAVTARSDRSEDAALRDSLSTALSRAPWMSVVADDGPKAREPDYAILAEVEGDGANKRVTAHIIDAQSQAIAWSFSAPAPNTSVQDPAFAAQVADAVWRGLYEAEGARLKSASPAGLSPREVIAKALSGGTYAPWTEQGVREAIVVLDKGLKKHPLDAELLASSAQAEFMLSVIDPTAGETLAPAAEEKLEKAVTMAPKSRWVTGIAADVAFSTGRYRAASDAYGRLIEQGYDLPATRARALDSDARVRGRFAPAAEAIERNAATLFSPLQKSQVNGALAYMRAAAGKDDHALASARLAVATYPNNPDAIRALIITALLAGDDPTVADAARMLCRFYPSYAFPEPERSRIIAASLAGDGGAEWRAFADRVAAAYAERADIVRSACAGSAATAN